MNPADKHAISIILKTMIDEFGSRLGDPSTRFRFFHQSLEGAFALPIPQAKQDEVVAALRLFLDVPQAKAAI